MYSILKIKYKQTKPPEFESQIKQNMFVYLFTMIKNTILMDLSINWENNIIKLHNILKQLSSQSIGWFGSVENQLLTTF